REIERVGAEEPGEVDLSPVWENVRQLYRTGLHPAVALHVRHKGRVVLDRTIGHLARPLVGDPGEVVTPESLFGLFSGSKVVTATLLHALAEDGRVGVDDPVAAWLPGFARHGKDNIRIRHLLNHTAGIPDMPRLERVDEILRSGRLDLEHLFDLKPQTPPGARVAYHPMTSWFLLQEIIERASGAGLQDALRARLLDPLGLGDIGFGVPVDQRHRVAHNAVTGPPVPAFARRVFDRTLGLGLDEAVALTNTPTFLDVALPSANVLATPAAVGAFMQMLLQGGELDGRRVLRAETVRRAITEVTPIQLDGTFGFPMRYGLGYMMGGNRFSLFGLGTRGAFGHLGLSTVVVFADPARELSVAFLNTGKPVVAPGMIAWYAVLQQLVLRVPRAR
ncbi:MAG TPA: serine hydrolase domain-containing protein, partial [Myxococcota bacterium]|nr:serine hydrolase domain-containing protein [Myxococcota bacterium]